jgi:putative membrane protein
MLWIKALHVVFMVTWFAGLFYLPRLFVYHAMCADEPGHQRLCIQERRLFILMTVGAALTVAFGVWLTALFGMGFAQGAGWFHAKLLFVAFLLAYHAWCWVLLKRFAERRNRHSHRWYRGFNEVPGVLLLVIVILAVVKPF